MRCWDIVKSDVILVVRQLSQLRGNTFNLLNTANIVLIPKKDLAKCIGDYRPISLVHSEANFFKDPCKQTGPTSSTDGFTEPKCLCQKELHSRQLCDSPKHSQRAA
jgi:hypothetical protein